MEYESGTMAVSAVPGAGKTFIVTNLVAKLLLEGKNDGKKILILTYMNSAVNNFKGRIKKILEENEIDKKNDYDVMTIHSLAIKIIRENPESIMLNEDFNVADDLQKSIILNECIDDYKSNGGDKKLSWFVKEQKDAFWKDKTLQAWEDSFFDIVGNAISKLKYAEISPEDLIGKMKEINVEILKLVYPIYRDYDRKLKKNGLLDYDDILILAHKALLADEGLRVKFENRYRYVFEDECQDSNEIQGEIIKLISEKNRNLVRVGDVNQSITGTFSSSDPKFFKEFMKEADYSHKMDMSNRSSADVIDLSNRMMQYVKEEFPESRCRDALEYTKIKTVPKGMGYKENPEPEGYNINVKAYRTWDEEIKNTVRYAKGINKKFPEKSIGILTPYNSQVSEIAEVMSNEKMDFEELGPNSSRKRRVLDSLATIINFLISPMDREKLLATVEVFLDGYSVEKKEESISSLRNLKLSNSELIYGIDGIGGVDGIEGVDSIDSIYGVDGIYDAESDIRKALNSIRNILEFPELRLDLLILDIGSSLNLDSMDSAVVDYISFYVGYMCREDENTTLRGVYDILADPRNRVFSHIIDVVYEINGYEPEPGSITICNYHKSKGLEWDCVFLLGMTKYNFPDNISHKFQGEKWFLKEKYKNPVAIIKSEIDKLRCVKEHSKSTADGIRYIEAERIALIDEKIRLLYVGMTRAKEMLILSYSQYRNDKDIGNQKKLQLPSQYLKVLSTYVQEKRRK
jgi:DNA helicase-2/ATP-dependent DNA helicase PcrA